jgi:hypothetical protein
MGDPHCGQNDLVSVPPLSPLTEKERSSPDTSFNDVSGMAKNVVKPLPVERWQSRQWQ